VGRVWRHPQKKAVEVYRLIGARTSDVFLNNISFDKGVIMQAFAMSSASISEYYISVLHVCTYIVNREIGRGRRRRRHRGDERRRVAFQADGSACVSANRVWVEDFWGAEEASEEGRAEGSGCGR